MVRSRCGWSGCSPRAETRWRASSARRTGRRPRAVGAEPVVLRPGVGLAWRRSPRHLEGADAAVFAAGAGPGSGAERKDTVDRDAAVLFADAAGQAGVRRYLIVSAMGADAHHQGD